MNQRRFYNALTIPILLAAVVAGAEPRDTAGLPQPELPKITVVLEGVVAWTEPPVRFALESGWVVTVPDAAMWPAALDAADGAQPVEVRVIGSVLPSADGLIVKAGAIAARRAGVRLRAGSSARFGTLVDDEEEETTLEGTITELISDGFNMETDEGPFTVTVDGETRYDEVEGLDDLRVGDQVEVEGFLSGTVLAATRVKLRDDDGGGGGGGGGGGDDGDDDGVDFSSKGRLNNLLPPDRFTMDDNRTYRVDASTIYENPLGGYAGLAVGQFLEVDAVRVDGTDSLVRKIEFEGDEDDGQGYREISGTVAAVDPNSLELGDGTLLVLTAATVFNGDADSASEIAIGWEVEIEALLDRSGLLTALQVRASDPDPATIDGQDFAPRQALVVLVPGGDAQAVAGRFGAQIAGRVGDLAVLLLWPDEIDNQRIAALTADPDVAAVEPNYNFRDPESVRRRFPIVDRSPTADKFRHQKALTQIGMDAAQQLTVGRGTVIAVIDTGVDPFHPTLRRRLLAGGLDLVGGDAEPWEERNLVDDDGDGDIDEAAGHGTFVASLIALAAPGAAILPYRVLDDDGGGTAFHLALALADAIQRRVDIINLSLTYHERSTAVDLLLELASKRGIVVVVSAGNDALTRLPFPASDSHVIAVTALAEDASGLASFANRSPLQPVAAPGVAVYGGLDGQSFGSSSGTSMAAPFVSAAVAMLLAADPGLDPALVRATLVQSGVPLADGAWSGVGLDMARAVGLVAR